jgi:hypothetical protein
MTYTVEFTNKTKTPITIDDDTLNSSLGIYLFGQNELAYGQEMQNNLLHLLENFAVTEDPNNPNNPDMSKVFESVLASPIEGRLWYNSTRGTLNYYNGTNLQPLAARDDLAANWGLIADGATLPAPISSLTGRVFTLDECVWIISPYNLPDIVEGFNCTTDDNGVVNMKYNVGGTQISGQANYLVIGIAGSNVQMQQTLTYTLNNAATDSTLPTSTALQAQCIPAITGGASGLSCSGVTDTCGAGNCAPTTGINFSLTISGGVAPYTVKMANISRTSSTAECVSFGYDSTTNKVSTNTPSVSPNVSLGSLGSNTFGPLSIQGDCGTTSTPTTGLITLTATDSVGHSRNIYINYTSQRLYPTNGVNQEPYTFYTSCPNAVTLLQAIGSPNYLFVQDSMLTAPGDTAYYMTRNFNITTSGIYTMKVMYDDAAFIYLDGTLVYSGAGNAGNNFIGNPCYTGNQPIPVQLNMSAGSHQLLVGYENLPANSPSYIVFSIYDPNGNLFYTSNNAGWLALTSTSGIQEPA